MPTRSSVPTPVAAALGLVPTALDRARRLPGKVVQLPILAVSSALTTLETCRKEYDDLAGRGERLVARLRGTSFDQVEDTVEQTVSGTPLAAPYDQVEEAVEQASEALVGTVSDLLDRAAQKKPTTKAKPKPQRHDTAVSDDVLEVVENAVADIAAPTPAHDALPLPDYDHLTLGSLRGRLRSLSIEELAQVRAYEKDHADRLPVVTLLDNRIAKLTTESLAT